MNSTTPKPPASRFLERLLNPGNELTPPLGRADKIVLELLLALSAMSDTALADHLRKNDRPALREWPKLNAVENRTRVLRLWLDFEAGEYGRSAATVAERYGLPLDELLSKASSPARRAADDAVARVEAEAAKVVGAARAARHELETMKEDLTLARRAAAMVQHLLDALPMYRGAYQKVVADAGAFFNNQLYSGESGFNRLYFDRSLEWLTKRAAAQVALAELPAHEARLRNKLKAMLKRVDETDKALAAHAALAA